MNFDTAKLIPLTAICRNSVMFQFFREIFRCFFCNVATLASAFRQLFREYVDMKGVNSKSKRMIACVRWAVGNGCVDGIGVCKELEYG